MEAIVSPSQRYAGPWRSRRSDEDEPELSETAQLHPDKAKTDVASVMDPSKYAAMLVAKAKEHNIVIGDNDDGTTYLYR